MFLWFSKSYYQRIHNSHLAFVRLTLIVELTRECLLYSLIHLNVALEHC